MSKRSDFLTIAGDWPSKAVFAKDYLLSFSKSLHGAMEDKGKIPKEKQPEVYYALPELVPEKVLVLPSRATVEQQQTTVGLLAERLYSGVTFDTALPQRWLDAAVEAGWDARGEVVWGYPGDYRVCGLPLPLFAEALESLSRVFPNAAEAVHNVFGHLRHAHLQSIHHIFEDAYHRQLQVEAFFAYTPPSPGYYGLPEDSEEGRPPEVIIESVEVYPSGVEILHLLHPGAVDQLEAAALEQMLEDDRHV